MCLPCNYEYEVFGRYRFTRKLICINYCLVEQRHEFPFMTYKTLGNDRTVVFKYVIV